MIGDTFEVSPPKLNIVYSVASGGDPLACPMV